MIRRFTSFELDEERFELRCDGDVLKVEPKVFGLLSYLAASDGRLVEKQELYDALWPDEIVSESALAYCVKSARRVLRSGGRDSVVIKAVHGRGFRFLVDVEEVAAGGSRDSGRVGGGQRAIFLGRDEELGRIDACLRDARHGSAQVVAVSGVAGIGKSSLATNLSKRARSLGFDCVRGQCYEGDDPPPFHPWAEVFREFADSHDPQVTLDLLGSGAADVVQMSPSLRNTLSGVDELPILEPGQARARFFDSVVAFFGAASKRKPLMVLFEDVHWADSASLQLFETTVRQLGRGRIVWVFTYRDTEVRNSDRLGQLLVTLHRESTLVGVPLKRLSDSDTSQLLSSTLPAETEGSTLQVLVELSQGNPLFAIELARYVREEGASAFVSGLGARRGKIPIPGGIAGVIARRMANLNRSCRKTLAFAAVIGATFSLNELSDVLGVPDDDVLEDLESATAAGVVVESVDGESYSFSHILFRQAMYGELGAARRARIHRRIADRLERRTARMAHPPLSELAHHFFQAVAGADSERALHYTMLAAADAQQRFAYEDAARLYAQALEALDLRHANDDRESNLRRCDLLLYLGEAQSLAGDPGGSRESYVKASRLADELDSPDRLARAALRGSGSLLQSLIVDDASIHSLEETLDKLRPGDSALRARVLSRLALTLYYHPSGDRRRRLELSDEAVEIARARGDSETLYWALISRHWALWGPASAQERLAVVDELVVLGEKLNSPAMSARAQLYRVGAYLELCDLDRVEEEVEVVENRAVELRIPLFQWSAGYMKSTLALLRGEFAAAEELRVQSFASGTRTESDSAYLVSLLQVANRCFLLGRMDDVAPEIEPLIEQGLPFPILRCAQVLAQWTEGRVDESRRGFREIMAGGLGAIPENNLRMVALGLLTALATGLGERKAARDLYEAIQPYEDTMIVAGNASACMGSTHYHLGLCAWAFGDGQSARDHLAKATAIHRRIGALPWLVMSLWADWRIDALDGEDADVGKRNEARAIAERIDMQGAARWLEDDVPSIKVKAKRRRGRKSTDKRVKRFATKPHYVDSSS